MTCQHTRHGMLRRFPGQVPQDIPDHLPQSLLELVDRLALILLDRASSRLRIG